jgi:hypothetical protein
MRGPRCNPALELLVERIDLDRLQLLQLARAQRRHDMTSQQLPVASERSSPYPLTPTSRRTGSDPLLDPGSETSPHRRRPSDV